MSKFTLIVLFPVAGTGAIAGLTSPGPLSRCRADLSNETAMASSIAPRRCLFVGLQPCPPFRPVTTAARPQDTLLWNAEVQYVCRNAARQSYGQQIRGSAAPFGFP